MSAPPNEQIQPAVGDGGGTLVISDDEGLSERDRLMEEFPYMVDTWEVPPSGDIRDYATFTLYDAGVPVDPKYAHEIMRVATRLDMARDVCFQTTDPIPHPFGIIMPPPHFTIVQVCRIQSYSQRRIFKTAVEEVAIRNGKLPESERGFEMECTAYHGTNHSAAVSIAKYGALMTRCEIGAYGRGFYTSLDNIGIPLKYATDNSIRHQEKPAIVMGECLVGKNSRTNAGQDIPNPGCDTGGCGNGWIHTIFDKNHFIADYIIVFKLATEDEWNMQVMNFAKASDMAHGIEPIVIVIPPTPPTTPPVEGAASGGPFPPIAGGAGPSPAIAAGAASGGPSSAIAAGAASGGPSPAIAVGASLLPPIASRPIAVGAGPSPPIAPGAASGGPSAPTGMKMARKYKKPRVSSTKPASPPRSPVPGSRYKPTPPTSDDSPDDKYDKSYIPGGRPRK